MHQWMPCLYKEQQVICVPCSIPLTELIRSHLTGHGSTNLNMLLYEMPNTKFSSI